MGWVEQELLNKGFTLGFSLPVAQLFKLVVVLFIVAIDRFRQGLLFILVCCQQI